MDVVEMPRIGKVEYDRLISKHYVARIAFKGDEYPYVAPFLYVFYRGFIYFLSTKYGKKTRYFRQNPNVSVEIEDYSPDFSYYNFVVLSGQLVEVEESEEKKLIKERFARMIGEKNLSKNVMVVLGHNPEEAVEMIPRSERTHVWKLVGVKQIKGLGYPVNSI